MYLAVSARGIILEALLDGRPERMNGFAFGFVVIRKAEGEPFRREICTG